MDGLKELLVQMNGFRGGTAVLGFGEVSFAEVILADQILALPSAVQDLHHQPMGVF